MHDHVSAIEDMLTVSGGRSCRKLGTHFTSIAGNG